MNQYLSLTEIAAKLGFKQPKTFAKYVRAMKIPHKRFGRQMRFDPVVVEAQLAALAVDSALPSVVTFKPVKSRSKVKSRFAEECGI